MDILRVQFLVFRVLSNLKTVEQDDFIKAKILEANMLIDRVKDTLSDIKNKSNRNTSTQDYEKYLNTIAPTDITEDTTLTPICYEPQITDEANESSVRPKTRRSMSCCNKKLDIENKFKTALCDKIDAKLETNDGFEILQARLNTIIEQAESESDGKENDQLKVTVDVDTDVKEKDVPQQSSAVQVNPEISSIGIQNTDTSVKTVETQTNKPQKSLCLENNCVVTIPPVIPILCKAKNLSIQHMPPIDIKRNLVVQRVLKFYIDHEDRTHFLPQSKAKNTRFYEINHIPLPSQKIRFNRNQQERQSSGSSELSFFKVAENPPRSKAVHGSVSDGELVLIRKKELKEGIETKTECKKEPLKDSSKELVLKSFHIYDNPNVHDPGDASMPLKMNSIDTFVYKTYINPNGLPSSSVCTYKTAMNIVTPETLQKISQHKPTGVKGQASYSGFSPRVSKSTTTTQDRSSYLMGKPPSKVDVPVNLYNLGIYSAKSTQVEPVSLVPSECTTEKSKGDSNTPQNLNASTATSCQTPATNTSYEKISVTVSYSTEETISSGEEEQRKFEYIHEQEKELRTVEPCSESHHKFPGNMSRASQDTFHILKEKFAKEGYKDESSHMNIRSIGTDESMSLESTVPQFIVGLTESTTKDIRKILPHIRKNVDSIHDKHSKNLLGLSETNIHKESSKKSLDDDHKEKHDPAVNKDYTVLSMQIHGDCLSNNTKMKNSHLKLGKNGRYKDEENLFCDDYSKITTLPLRRRVLRNIPRYSFINKYTLDSSSCDLVSIGSSSLSEGEIKCQNNVSIGEIRKRAPSDHLSRIRQKVIQSTKSSEANVIRERRTYFNHWVTYYINKNASTPLLSHSSSTNST